LSLCVAGKYIAVVAPSSEWNMTVNKQVLDCKITTPAQHTGDKGEPMINNCFYIANS